MANTLKIVPPSSPAWRIRVYEDEGVYFTRLLTSKTTTLIHIDDAVRTVIWIQTALFETCHVFKTKEEVRILIAESLADVKK